MTTTGHRVLDKPLMSFNIPEEIAKLKQGDQWRNTHRGATTLVKNADVRIVLVVLSARMALHEHQAEGPITVSVAEGSIVFRAAGEQHRLSSGGLLALGGAIAHDVEALEESAFVITVVQPSRAG